VPLIECVPNVSEGIRSNAIDTIERAIQVRGAHLLDRSSDPSHNRTVYTLAGTSPSLQTAVLRLFDVALAQIDLRTHVGVHPRIGAVDVVPFVPLSDTTTLDECAALARETAALVADRFAIPVFLYEAAAYHPHRRSLSDLRRGGLEGLAARMGDGSRDWKPDFGPHAPHPSAGVTAIGARPILIAFNVNLRSDRLDLARRIAAGIRESSGGFAAVKAIGLRLAHRSAVQVSMNLTDFRRTSMVQVFDEIARQAHAAGVDELEGEIVGLVPAAALPPEPRSRLRLTSDPPVLETRLERALAVS
jgi:glutamate formiminotransferase / 5-formyltetrahydrofolate cyclo-ligase